MYSFYTFDVYLKDRYESKDNSISSTSFSSAYRYTAILGFHLTHQMKSVGDSLWEYATTYPKEMSAIIGRVRLELTLTYVR